MKLLYLIIFAFITVSTNALFAATTDFVTRWQTTDGSITIPTAGTGYNYNLIIKKVSDGTTLDTQFGLAGAYTNNALPNGEMLEVIITGTFPRIYFNNVTANATKIYEVTQWGNIHWTSFTNAFYACSNLNITATDAPDLTQANLNMSQMFRGCSSLNADLSAWNTSTVTNMAVMFYGATIFNQDISGWNTGNVTTMANMFQNAKAFNQNINGWNVSKVTTMANMFNGASVFNQNLDSWDVSKVTTTANMFQGATAFNGTLNWGAKTGAVTTMYAMFDAAKAFNQNIDGWDVKNVTTMAYMFRGASVFNQNLDSWDVSKVTTMYAMFDAAKAFNQNIDGWDVKNVTTMTYMFRGASVFNQNLDSWDVSKVTTMAYMFQNATAFNGTLNWGAKTGAVTTMYAMFDAAKAFNQNIGPWKTGAVTTMAYMFRNASAFDQDIKSWDVSSVTTMSNMFNAASKFNKELGSWNVSNVTTMAAMFANSGMTYCTFDKTIKDWSLLVLQSNVPLAAREFSDASLAERNTIIGTYTWTITGTNKGANPLTVTPANTTSQCIGSTYTLTSNALPTNPVTWSTLETTTKIDVAPTTIGLNSYTVTDVCGSTATANITLPNPTGALAPNGSSTTCTLSGTNPVHFFDASRRYIGSIDPNGGTGRLSMTVYVAAAAGTMKSCTHPTDLTLETAYMQRSFVIKANPTAYSGGTAELFLPFTAGEQSNLSAKALTTTLNTVDDVSGLADISVTKYNGLNENSTPLDNCTGGVSSVLSQNASGAIPFYGISGNYASFMTSSFSEFNLHGKNNGSPLPIELTSFSARCNNGQTQLTWTTATETNVNHFEILRSRDGESWNLVASENAVGNSSVRNNYAISDNGYSEMYYRLVSVDNDGTRQEFNPISVQCDVTENSWSVYPVPTNSIANVVVVSTVNSTSTINIVDLNGKVVNQITTEIVAGENIIPVNVTNFNNGTYILSLDGFKPLKIVKMD